MKKRTFTYVLALITIVCLLASSASAAAPDTLNGDTIQRRLTYIHSLATTVKISDSGQAICQGRATLSASLTMKLQRSSNGSSWTTLKTWTATDTGTIFMEESWPVAPGYYYQTVVTAEAYTSSGSVAETVTASSAVVKY